MKESFKKILAIILILSIGVFGHEWCGADDHPPEHVYAEGLYGENSHSGRVLQSSYKNIRIEADFSQLVVPDSALKSYIQDKLVPATLNYFRKALKVKPLTKLYSPSATICNGAIPVPSTYLSPNWIESDLLIFVTASDEPGQSFLAWAMACVQDSITRRPVIGQINYNIATNRIQVRSSWSAYQDDLTTSMHELTHVLAFSSGLFDDYIDPSTNTLLPSSSVLVSSWNLNGKTTTGLVVEPLFSYAKDYFGCSSLYAVPLENQGGSGSLGSHWERRVFYNEFMTASQIKNTKVTTFTLKLFEASGWYQPDYSMAEEAFWGKGRGCGFIDQTCLDGTQTARFPEFCTGLTSRGCTPTHSHVGYCGASTTTRDSGLDSAFNYWGDNTIVGDSYADNCPYIVGYSNKDCEDPASLKFIDAEVHAAGSRCFSGQFGVTLPGSKQAYCLPNKCEKQADGSYHIKIQLGSGVVCTAAGPVSVPAGFAGTLDCPDPNIFCPNFAIPQCIRGCMGKGTCNKATGACTCDCGWQGKDCSEVKVEACDTVDPFSISDVEGPSDVVNTAEDIRLAFEIITYILLGSSFIVMMAGLSPVYFFRQLSTLQSLLTLNLLNFKYPASFETALGFLDIGKLDFIPNPFSWFISGYKSDGVEAPIQFLKRKLTGLFLKNSGHFLFIFVASGIIHLASIICKMFTQKAFADNMKNTLGLPFSFRLIIGSSMIIITSTIISLVEPDFKTTFHSVSYGVTIATFIGYLGLFSYISVVFYRWKKQGDSTKHHSIGSKDLLFEGYMSEDKKKATPFNAVLILKNIAIVAVIRGFYEYPITQISASTAISIVSTIVLIKFRPSVQKREHILDLFTEVLISIDKILVIIFAIVYEKESNFDNGKNNFGWAMTGMVIATLAVPQIYSLHGVFKFTKLVKSRLTHNKIHPQTTKVETFQRIDDVSSLNYQATQLNISSLRTKGAPGANGGEIDISAIDDTSRIGLNKSHSLRFSMHIQRVSEVTSLPETILDSPTKRNNEFKYKKK